MQCRIFKGSFCSIAECNLCLTRNGQQKKKVINFYYPFSLTNLAFLSFLNKTTVIGYLYVTVILESLDLTALLEYLNSKLQPECRAKLCDKG